MRRIGLKQLLKKMNTKWILTMYAGGICLAFNLGRVFLKKVSIVFDFTEERPIPQGVGNYLLRNAFR